MLSRHDCRKLKKPHQIRLRFPKKGFVTFGYTDYAALACHGRVLHEFDKITTKFVFCRKPDDHPVSLFASNKRLRKIPEDQSFLDFCRRLVATGIQPVGLHHARGLGQRDAQVHWMENLSMDLLGRDGNLQADTARLLELLQLPLSPEPRLRTLHYRDDYCDESCELVKTFYAEDFAPFDYPTRL